MSGNLCDIIGGNAEWFKASYSYRNESPTLTADAEANLLKLRELLKILTPEEATRWDDIKRTFARNLLTHGGDEKDPASRIVGQLSAFGAGLDGNKRTLAAGRNPPEPKKPTSRNASASSTTSWKWSTPPWRRSATWRRNSATTSREPGTNSPTGPNKVS